MKITKKQLRQIIKEAIGDDSAGWPSVPPKQPRTGGRLTYSRTGTKKVYSGAPDYGEGNLTIDDVQELFPSLSRGEQDDIWEKYKHLNNAGELKAAILGL